MEPNNSLTSEIISNILNRYNLKESEEDLARKFFMEPPDVTNGEAIFWISMKLIKEEATEKDLSSFLKERLKISQETTERLKEDIKKELLPLLKRGAEKKPGPAETKEEEIKKIEILPKIKPPIGIPKIGDKIEIKPEIVRPAPVQEKSEKKFKEIKRQPTKKGDTYREPVE